MAVRSIVSFLILFVLFANAQPDARRRPCPGASAKVGDTIHVHYAGFIDKSSATGKHDKMFDNSHKRGRPFTFKLGAGQVIRGWDQGLV